MPQVQQSDLYLFVYSRIKDNLDDSFVEWKEKAEKCDFEPIYTNDKLVAVVITKDSDVHVVGDLDYRGKIATRAHLRRVLGRIFNKYGKVTTSVGYGDNEKFTLMKRLGFEPDMTTFVMEELKWK